MQEAQIARLTSSVVPEVSIVVPTYREAGNVGILIDRIFDSMIDPPPDQVEVIIVDDDSHDGIDAVIARSQHRDRIRLIVRKNERGLASAVLLGIANSAGRILVVMDADLSHPPEQICNLIAPIREGRAEMVVGSRYIRGGANVGWGLFRKLNSQVATWLAKPFTNVTDPMSGFFALSRQVFCRAPGLNPIGYKIGLELMVKCRCRPVLEIPIKFVGRLQGRSKLSLAEQLRYLEHLSRLYDFKFPRLVPVLKFLIVTLFGFAGGLLWMLMSRFVDQTPVRWQVTRGWALTAYWPAIAVNLLAYWRYIKQMRGLVPIRRPRFYFGIISSLEWIAYLAAIIVIEWMTKVPFMNGRLSSLAWIWVPFAAAFATRFLLRKLAGHDIRGLPPQTGGDLPIDSQVR
jgi:glycosyltransferase involved in cell wall biosynthesis